MSRTWRIGEVAERTGLTRRTLRHYDELGLLIPSSRSWGDYRLYDEADLLRLLQIQNLKALGLSLQEIAAALADPLTDASATLRSHLESLEARIADEQRLAGRLRRLAAAAERPWEEVLDVIALSSRLGHADPNVRLQAAFRSTGSSPAELLQAMAAEPDVAVRDALLLALTRHPDAAEAAVAVLASADPAARAAGARVLSKLRHTASVPALIARLEDADDTVVAAAVDALARLGDPAAAAGLAALLGAGRVQPMNIIEALAGLGAEAAAPVIERLGSGDAVTRAQAAETLGWLGSAAAVPALADAAADEVPAVRLAAVIALGELGDAGRPALEALLADPELGRVARRLLDLLVTSTSGDSDDGSAPPARSTAR